MEKIIAGEFSESYPPLMDGVGQVVMNYEKILRDEYGYIVKVITTYNTENGNPDTEDENVIRFPMTPIKSLGAYGITKITHETKKRVCNIDYDIIHTHSPFSIGKLGAKIANGRGIPHVTTFHSQFRKDVLAFTHSNALASLVTAYLIPHYRKADLVITPNKRSVEVLQSYGYNGNTVIVENATDMEIPTEKEHEEYQKRALELLGIDGKTRPILLFIGQHSDKKNIPLIIDSLRQLKERNDDFLMVFVGDGEDRKKYERMREEYALQDNIRFMGLVRNRQDVRAFYSIADLFLFPSLYDVSSLTMRETAAFSLPCLFVDSVTSEMIEDGVNGFISAPDAASYASCIEEIIRDDGLRKTVGSNARRMLYRNFHDAVKEIDKLYRMLIGR